MHEKWLDASVWLIVLLLHGLALFALMGSTPPTLAIGVEGMELVALGDLNLGKAMQAAQPHAATISDQQPAPEKRMLSVTEPTAQPDVVEKPKPKPQPKPKPTPRRTPSEPIPQSSRHDRATAGSTDGANTGASRTAAGGSQAGSGQGATVATHLGGHLNNPKPPYPPLSMEYNEQGTVRLRVVVEPDGRPSSVELAQSSGFSRLDNTALRTVRERYRFTPATRLGVSVQSIYTFSIVFKLGRR